MRGGTNGGASGHGVASFGSFEQQMRQLTSNMSAPSNNSTNLLTGKAGCGMTGGKYPKKKRGMKKRKSHGGSGLTAIAVPAILVAANQMYSRKGRKGKSFRRRRSMRGGSFVAASAGMDSTMAHGMKANLELPFGKAGADMGIQAGMKTAGEISV